MNIAIIGCGLIGQKRAKTLKDCHLVACADPIRERAEKMAQSFANCVAYTDWKALLDRQDIHIVIVATTHVSLAEITKAAAKLNIHVLVEKPAGRKAAEIISVIEETKNSDSLIRVGFNHRYHRAFRKARELIDENKIGELMFIRARYGHGGRIGYDQEWRAQPALSGGGELIDQGVHLIDLARWFLGDFTEINGSAHTYYWDMHVDDNGFLLLKTAKQQVAFLHASCTEWKNLFSFEIYGKLGKIDIHGLGGSYGVERITYYKMLPEMGPPETYSWEYPMADDSWECEWNEFLADIQAKRQPNANLNDALSALQIVEKIYKDSGYDNRT